MVAQGAWSQKVVDLSELSIYNNNNTYVAKYGDVLTGSLPKYRYVSIANGATVTLRNVRIQTDFVTTDWKPCLECGNHVTIILEEGSENVIWSYLQPGIKVGPQITIKGTGELKIGVYGSCWYPGIGGDNCGNIVIEGGTITTSGGMVKKIIKELYDWAIDIGAPGIGAAVGGSCGNITISGGTIYATGQTRAAGIGKSYKSTCGTITIYGNADVHAYGGEYGAGIGGGMMADGCTVRIEGGKVYACGGEGGAGIGGGDDADFNAGGSGGDILISGGDVEAHGGDYAAGIGAGDCGKSGGTITINGGTVKAYGGKDAAGIGGGESSDGDQDNSGNIVINGGDVYACGKGWGVGIGAGEDGDVEYIRINGGTIVAEGGDDIHRAVGGEDDEDFYDNHLSLGSGIMAYITYPAPTGDVVLQWALRQSQMKDYGILKFKPCDHAGATYSIVNAEKHQCTCQWCGIFEEDHTAQTPCTKCGYTGKTLDLSTVQSNLTVLDGVTVTGTLNTASHPVKITIADGATVTLSGMNISGVNNSSYKWAGITCEGDATIILADGTTNTVKGFYEDYPGIYVPQNYSLTIKGETAGTGSLNASSNGFGAGIGGGYCGASCGVISINGGNITATGGKYCAGIGSSHNNSCSHILINGGTIHATGGENAAGIGSGWGGTNAGDFSSCGMINILSDVTSVTATKGAGAPNSIGAGYQGTCSVVVIGSKVGAVERSPYYYFPLANASSNSTKISAFNGEVCDVTLKGRTLYKDNSWNTLCLPFSISDFSGTPLAGATVKTLESTSFDSTNGALTLNFTEANLTAIEAGKPYIVKWASGDNIENPMFTNVTITATTPTDITPTGSGSDGSVTFKGTFGPHDIGGTDGDNTKLYLGNGNKLYWSSGAKSINSFRAYFQLNNGITAGNQPNSGVRAFVLNFDGDEETGIATTNYTDSTDSDNAWYDLSGRKLSGKPTTKGLYINKGKMIVIK